MSSFFANHKSTGYELTPRTSQFEKDKNVKLMEILWLKSSHKIVGKKTQDTQSSSVQLDCWHKWVDIAVCFFAISHSNVYIHLLFTKIILLDTIYSPKFLQSCFYSIIHTQKYYILLKS